MINSHNITYVHFFTSFSFLTLLICNRLVIHSLTDQVFLAMSMAVQDGAIGNMIGNKSSGKRGMVSSLAQELGVEVIEVDCSMITDPTLIMTKVKAALGCGLWLEITNYNSLSKEIASVLLTTLSVACDALAARLNNCCIFFYLLFLYFFP